MPSDASAAVRSDGENGLNVTSHHLLDWYRCFFKALLNDKARALVQSITAPIPAAYPMARPRATPATGR
jgi:hypothetical protein